MPNRLQPALTVVNYFTCATAEPWPAHNLWNLDVIQAVCRACKRLADAQPLRVGVIFGLARRR